MPAPDWFQESLGWKDATAKARPRCMKAFGEPIGPNLADLSGTSSTVIAGEVYELLGIPRDRRRGDIGEQGEGGQRAAGIELEIGLETDIRESLRQQAPEAEWFVTRAGKASQFAQFEHLDHLQRVLEEDPTLRTTVGRDYQVSTDVMVGVANQWGSVPPYSLHAAISSKLTIRSDRVQNVRVEFGTLVRNRRGRSPHLVLVTAEPLPSRLISIARGTGEIDAVYHLLYDEMSQALSTLRARSRSLRQQFDQWTEMVEMRRMRPYRELAAVVAKG